MYLHNSNVHIHKAGSRCWYRLKMQIDPADWSKTDHVISIPMDMDFIAPDLCFVIM